MNIDLKDKVAIVTGAARGIGFAIANRIAKSGAKVVLADLNEEALAEAKVEIEKITSDVFSCITNVASGDDVNKLVEMTMEKWGRVDILVNNAGITRDSLLIRMKESDWDAVLNVNLKSAFFTTKAAAKILMKQRSGVIVNVASVIGLIGNPGQANYSASKAGIIAFTKSMAKELAPRGIRVNAIAPGFIESDMTKILPENVKQGILDSVPMGRLGLPDEVADTVLFLVSDYSKYITGQVLKIDGGMVM